MTIFTDEETALLDKIAIDMALDPLPPLHRALVVLRVAYELPDDYAGPWPPRHSDIGKYVGQRYRKRRLHATQTRDLTDCIIAALRRKYAPAPESSPCEAETIQAPALREAA